MHHALVAEIILWEIALSVDASRILDTGDCGGEGNLDLLSQCVRLFLRCGFRGESAMLRCGKLGAEEQAATGQLSQRQEQSVMWE